MMQSLKERIEAYCSANSKLPLYGRHLTEMGSVVARELREKGLYDHVKKKKESMEVNSFPKNLLPIVDGVIELYYTDLQAFRKKTRNTGEKPPVRYFNYDVETRKSPSFEAALTEMGLEISINFKKEEVTQYRLPFGNPAHLVKLGKLYQKHRERYKAEQRRRRYMYRQEPG
jgi:hypothetical protein